MNVVLELRRRAGLTQDLLAGLSGVSSTAISRYETGQRTPTLSTLARLAGGAEFDAVVSFVPRAENSEPGFTYPLDTETKPPGR